MNLIVFGLNLTDDTKVEMEVFLDNVFYQNYSERPKNFDGSTLLSPIIQYAIRIKIDGNKRLKGSSEKFRPK